jgi:hypothetical protein
MRVFVILGLTICFGVLRNTRYRRTIFFLRDRIVLLLRVPNRFSVQAGSGFTVTFTKYQTLHLRRECTIHAQCQRPDSFVSGERLARMVDRSTFSIPISSTTHQACSCKGPTSELGSLRSGCFCCQVSALDKARSRSSLVLNLTHSGTALPPVLFPCSVTGDPPLLSSIPRCRPGPPPPCPISLAINLFHPPPLQLFSMHFPVPMQFRVPLPGRRLRPPALVSPWLPRRRHKLRLQNKVIRVNFFFDSCAR